MKADQHSIERADVDAALRRHPRAERIEVVHLDGQRHTYGAIDIGRIRWPVRRARLLLTSGAAFVVDAATHVRVRQRRDSA